MQPQVATSTSAATPSSAVIRAYEKYVVPSYGRSTVMVRGEGSYLWDEGGKRYLDFGGGIAVNSLGHAHPAIQRALAEQSAQLIHCSNLYYHPRQAQLAERLVELCDGSGKVFFCNSGAEANDMLYKLARKFGQDDGRYEVITALKSFHGRTLGGIAATGQDKIKKGFAPMVPGFRHVPFNDLSAVEAAITPQTAAVLIEGIQGEGGIHVASPEYLLALQKLCRDRKLLLLMDAIQCGMFRSGCFIGYQRILEGRPDRGDFQPDAISMAKSLGGGFPIGAVWLKTEYADLFQPGTHGTTYGGNALGCAVALAVLDTIRDEKLVDNIRRQGDALKEGILASNLCNVAGVRGYGLILGIQLRDLTAADAVTRLRDAGLLVIPSGDETLRLLPAYNVTGAQVEEALGILRANL